ncbi:glycosyltransferase family 29 protein [Paracoccus sphaerophysae]|uniref:Glycosyltransferase family 29 (Sialyltransferase) n=1 Tax=Paracoccus sphaerophysae TaxID=690417 RepID=A0A099FG21_9RHOB|nr:glycosyltransferase family 29 protein [Paracoccus sphaerophysae]KGJ09484.1 hypothetical protein IC63_01600 [Paracoccus sphaerophysae]
MTPLRFYAARTLRNEPMLRSLSVPLSELVAQLGGKRVALVGNARSLAEGTQGAQIDAADLVVRINRAPMPAPESHGTRTDWLALAVRLPQADRARLAPGRILWMSPKRKRLDWRSAHSPGFYLFPLDDYQALEHELGAPPSTGFMAIRLLLEAPLATLTLYGFDFFASRSLSGSRSAEQVPHDFAAEAAWVEDRAARDPRLRVAPSAGRVS